MNLVYEEEVGMTEGGVELTKVLERREAALKEWRTLSSRSTRDEDAALERVKELNRLADDIAEEQARAVEEEQRKRVTEGEQALVAAEAAVTKLKDRLAENRRLLTRLGRERLKARRYDPAARASVETLEAQEREQIQWYARERPGRPDQWPIELSAQIAERVEQMRAENEASRVRRAEEARRSWLPSGRSKRG